MQNAENGPSGAPDAARTDEDAGQPRVPSSRTLLLSAVGIVVMASVIRVAWVCDDAFIVFRVLDNLVHGLGPVSNVGERVQGFTSPLWMLLLAIPYALTREGYYTSIILSLLLTGVAVWLAGFRLARGAFAASVAMGLLALSRAFTDFSASGLENPLSHVLIGLFLLAVLGDLRPDRRTLLAGFSAGLLLLTRVDLGILVLPPLAALIAAHRTRVQLLRVASGFAPLAAWSLFALLYYGFVLPNTALSKLHTSLSHSALASQGLAYLLDSLWRDPLTLLCIAAAIASAIVFRSRRTLPIAAGILLHLAYVVVVGGDFMSGRFLTVDLYASVVLLSVTALSSLSVRQQAGLAVGLVTLVSVLPYHPLNAAVEPCSVPDNGVVDERSCYFDTAGLVRNLHKTDTWMYQTHKYYQDGLAKRASGERVYTATGIGMRGYAAGPTIHLIDEYGLTDPLVARMRHQEAKWRIGHFRRVLPEGYVETVRTGVNVIKPVCLHSLYDHVKAVTSGPLFSAARLREIWRFQVGAYDGLGEPSCSAP